MSQASERRRKPRLKAVPIGEPKWVMLLNVAGSSGDLRAKLVDTNDTGIAIETPCALRHNDTIVVQGLNGHSGPNGKIRARVVQCQAFRDVYRAGLAYENVHAMEKPAEAVTDYYSTKSCKSAPTPIRT